MESDTQKKEASDNELIAEFMGFTCFETEHDRFYSPPNMPPASPELWKYHQLDLDHFYPTSWDWLMPVVEKIYSLKDTDPYIVAADDYMRVLDFSIVVDRGVLYKAVVEFIKWYQLQKNG